MSNGDPAPVTQAQASTAAQQLAAARGLDAEHTSRLIVEYMDLWASRWQFALPTGRPDLHAQGVD